MGRNCKICAHPQRSEIDSLLVKSSTKKRHISKIYDVSSASIYRHIRGGHIPKRIAKAEIKRESSDVDSLLQELQEVRNAGKAMYDMAIESGKIDSAAKGLREWRGALELLAKIEQRIGQRKTTVIKNQFNAPVLIQMRATILQALAPYPEARRAVSQALLEIPQIPGSSPTQTDEE